MTDTPLGTTTFTWKRVQELLGLSRSTVSALISAGFVTPVRGPRNEHRFSFQDLLVLRTAFTLQQARIPPRKILRSLARLKAELPAELPLTGLRITAVGADVAVRDPSGQWQAETGQLLMDFEVAEVGGAVAFIPAATPPASSSSSAAASPVPASSAAATSSAASVDWFRRGQSLEADDPAAAEAAYRRAIDADPQHPWAILNLGAMLSETERVEEAVALYDRAAARLGDEPLLHFNHAIALEDLGRHADAVAAYERVLALDAGFADAHYNLALLLEGQGDPKGALRHFNAYRRLAPGTGG